MKKIRKSVIAAVLAGIVAASSATSASAYVWYSDSDRVRFYESTPNIRVGKMWTTSTFTRSLVEGWVSDAALDWRTGGTGYNYAIPNSFTSGNGTGDITIHAGKAQTMGDYYDGVSFIGSNGGVVNGLTSPSSNSYATITVDGITKYVRKATSATIYVLNKQSSGTYEGVSYNARTETGHKNTVKHEIGHALGYAGHSTSTSDLMTGSGTSNSTLLSITTRDRRHIGQFLNYSSNNSNNLESQAASVADVWLKEQENADTKLSFVSDTMDFVDNVIVGKPVDILQGSLESLSPEDEDCIYLLTEYLFEVSDRSEEDEKKYITVRSQVGNIFELGKEYTFSAMRIDNTLFDLYTVNSRKWVIDNECYSERELEKLRNAAEKKGIFSTSDDVKVIKAAEATSTFVNNVVDVAVIATVSDVEEDGVNSAFDVYFSDASVIKGKVPDYILREGVRIKDKVVAGNTYLMLFSQDEDGNLIIAAKENAVINSNSADYNKYLEVLGVK